MKKLKTIMCVVLVLAMAVALCACGGGKTEPAPAPAPAPSNNSTPNAEPEKEAAPQYTDKYVLRLGTTDPEQSLFYEYVITPLADSLSTHSDGRISLEYYASSTVCGFGSSLDCLRSGTIDIGQEAFAFYTGVYPYTELINMCGVDCGSLTSFNKLMVDYSAAFPESMFDEFYVFPRYCSVEFGWLTIDKPVEKMSDLAGKSIRSTGSAMDFVNGTGAIGVMVGNADLFESLKLNVIEGAFYSLGGTNSMGLYDIANYFTFMPAYYGDNALCMSLDVYNSMDPDAQAAVDAAKDEFLGFVNKFSEVQDPLSLEEIQSKNPNFKTQRMGEAETAEFLAMAKGLMDQKAADMDAAGLDGTGALEWINTHCRDYYEG